MIRKLGWTSFALAAVLGLLFLLASWSPEFDVPFDRLEWLRVGLFFAAGLLFCAERVLIVLAYRQAVRAEKAHLADVFR